MGWANLPTTADTTDAQAWTFIEQFNAAVRERGWGAGFCNWPRPSFQWLFNGVVPSGITETSFTDSGRTWCGGTDDTSGFTYANPWGCVVYNSLFTAGWPTTWFLIIDDNDPAKVVRTPINSWTNTGTLNFDSIRDYFTNGQLAAGSGNSAASCSSLVGKTYTIIGWGYSLWWHERVMPWPNAYELAAGTVATVASGKDFDNNTQPAQPTHTSFRDTSMKWKTDELKNTDLLVYGDDSHLHRINITGNTTDKISFTTQTWTPAIGSAYCVVATGLRAIPGRARTQPYAWYTGRRIGYGSHDANDNFTTAEGGEGYEHVEGHGPGGDAECDGRDELVWDADFWTDFPLDDDDIDCGRQPDKPYSNDLFKSLRGLQLGIEGLSPYYVDSTRTYDGSSAIQFINPAEMFALAGVNNFTGTTGNVEDAVGNDGSSNNAIAISGVTMPYTPIQVWYSIHQPGTNNHDYLWGRGVMTANDRLLDSSSGTPFRQTDDSTSPSTPGDDGRTIVISPGWTRIVPRQFKRMYDTPAVFVPDVVVDPDTGIASAIDPAEPVDFDTQQCYGVGSFQAFGKSTSYIERKHEEQTYDSAQGFAYEIGDTFADGDLATYVGDNYSDPTLVSIAGLVKDIGDTSNPTAKYYDRFFTGGSRPDNQQKLDQKLTGQAESGGTYFLKDTQQNWYDFAWFGGVMRTEGGTATGGSTTSIEDDTKAEADHFSPSNPLGCFWQPARWQGRSPYVGFVVEIDIPGTDPITGDPITTTYERLITSSDDATIAVTWSEALPSTASGMVYRIKEPYKVGRYNGRQIKFKRWDTATGAFVTTTSTITGNSEDTLFFTAIAWPVDKLTSYEIVDPPCGGVWKWQASSSKWVKPTGADTARLGITTAKDFHANQAENLPDFHKRYGKFTLGDAVCSGVFDELYKCLNVLVWTKVNVGWDSASSSGGTPELNHKFGGSGGQTSSFSDERDHGKANYTTQPATTAGGPPFVAAQAGNYGDPDCTGYTIERQYAYPYTADPECTRRAHSVSFLVYAVQWIGGIGAPAEWDAEGDDVIQDHWSEVGGAGPLTTAGPTYGPKVGSLAMPDDVPDPCPGGPTCTNTSDTQGYQITDQAAILKWNVSGGFVYVA